MAKKLIFMPNEQNIFKEEFVDFVYIKGMAFSQKQKNVLSFHKSIQEKYPTKKILEISTKSDNELGIKLSAFNLTLNGKCLESVYQSSKVFEENIQYPEIIELPPRDARHYLHEHTAGKLIAFSYQNQTFPLEPKSLFYDYIYIKALCEHQELADQLLGYDIFTDIEFNEKRQVNCQARACALYVFIKKNDMINYYLSSINHFKTLYNENKQLSLF